MEELGDVHAEGCVCVCAHVWGWEQGQVSAEVRGLRK